MAHAAYLAVFLNGAVDDEPLFNKLTVDLAGIGWDPFPGGRVDKPMFTFTKPLSIQPDEVESLAEAVKSRVEMRVWPHVSIQLATYEHGPVVF